MYIKLHYIKLHDNKSAYYLSETCARLSWEHVSVGVSERVNFQWSSISNHLQFLLPSCIKRFTAKGKQILSHFLEKLLITKAIYQLHKYNKAWLNTNLGKTPTLFTVEFQELLEIFWETYRFNLREFCTFTCTYTLRLQKRGFLYKTAFLPGLKFSNLRTDVSLPQEKSGSSTIIVFGSPECWDSLWLVVM